MRWSDSKVSAVGGGQSGEALDVFDQQAKVARHCHDKSIPPGVGKSVVGQANGYEAFKVGYTVYYRSIFDLVRQLQDFAGSLRLPCGLLLHARIGVGR